MTRKKEKDLSVCDHEERERGYYSVGVCMLCACDIEESEDGVGAGVNTVILSETVQVISLVESLAAAR